LFRYNDKENFEQTLKEMFSISHIYGNNAYKTYLELTVPSYVQRLIKCFGRKINIYNECKTLSDLDFKPCFYNPKERSLIVMDKFNTGENTIIRERF
jgi:hypothetical protein